MVQIPRYHAEVAVQTLYAHQRLRQLSQAQRYVELDARLITVQRLSGLMPRELQRWFYRHPDDVHRGRAPCATEWYQYANLIQRVDAALVTILFYRHYARGLAAEDALLSAYQGYRELSLRKPRIDFDHAFDLAAHTVGLWLTNTPRLSVTVCTTCRSETLTDHGRKVPLRCPFCQLLQRYSLDPRLQVHVPMLARSVSAPVLGIDRLCPDLVERLTPVTRPGRPRS